MLEGIKVIEMATYIAAPGAGGILADWGADVIKIEPLSGCPMRYTMANMGADHLKGSPIFDLDNRGKRGVVDFQVRLAILSWAERKLPVEPALVADVDSDARRAADDAGDDGGDVPAQALQADLTSRGVKGGHRG